MGPDDDGPRTAGPLDDVIARRDQGIAATRQLAKLQLTWLRATEDVTEFDCLAEDVGGMVLEYIRQELEAQIVSGDA